MSASGSMEPKMAGCDMTPLTPISNFIEHCLYVCILLPI